MPLQNSNYLFGDPGADNYDSGAFNSAMSDWRTANPGRIPLGPEFGLTEGSYDYYGAPDLASVLQQYQGAGTFGYDPNLGTGLDYYQPTSGQINRYGAGVIPDYNPAPTFMDNFGLYAILALAGGGLAAGAMGGAGAGFAGLGTEGVGVGLEAAGGLGGLTSLPEGYWSMLAEGGVPASDALGAGAGTLGGGMDLAELLGGLASDSGFLPGSFDLGAGSGGLDLAGSEFANMAAGATASGGLSPELELLLKRLFPKMGGLSSMLNMGSGIAGLVQSNRLSNLASEQANRADPFGPERAGYATRLRELYSDPTQIERLPGYQAGLNAVQRRMASQGYNGSGNMMQALRQYGTDAFNSEATRLGQLAGAGFAPGNNNALLQGGMASGDMLSRALATLGYGVRGMGL